MAGLAARPALVLGRLAQPRPLASRRDGARLAPPGLWAACALLAAGAIPVRLSVLAPGELVAAQPAVLRAPLDGVVAQIHVQPNQIVKQGQPLFSLDEAQIASRLQVAQQALSTAEAEYRQFAQMALGDPRSKAQLAALAGKIGERRAEQAFLAEQLGRASVTAPRDGMVLFDSPSEWIGKPVQTGERVMRVADPDAVEIEAWVPVGDAIPLAEGAPLRLYLAADPLTAVQGRVRYMAYDAVARPDGSYAYRVRASLDQAQGPRIGLKGTAKLQGERVPLACGSCASPGRPSASSWRYDAGHAPAAAARRTGPAARPGPAGRPAQLDAARSGAQPVLPDRLGQFRDPAALAAALARRDRAAHPGRDHAARRTGRCRGHAPLPGAARAVAAGRADRGRTGRQRQRRRAGWSQWLLHNYLFFRVPLLRPDRWLTRWTPRLAFLYGPAFRWLTLAALLAGMWGVSRSWDAFTATLVDMLSWKGWPPTA